jgi:hypothetical protein
MNLTTTIEMAAKERKEHKVVSRNQTHFLNMRKQRQRSDGRYKMSLCSLRVLLFKKILLRWQDFKVLHYIDKSSHVFSFVIFAFFCGQIPA